MRLFQAVVQAVHAAVKAANYVTTATIWLLVCVIMVGVVARLVGHPLSGITSLSEFMLVIAVYFGVAYAQQKKEHVYLELVLNKLGPMKRQLLTIAGSLASTLICGVVVYTSWLYALESWAIRERMDGTPHFVIYPTKIAIAVGLSLLLLQLVADVVDGISSLIAGSQPKQQTP